MTWNTPFVICRRRSETPKPCIGPSEIRDRLEGRREELGISYVVIQGKDRDVMEQFARDVLEPLAGK